MQEVGVQKYASIQSTKRMIGSFGRITYFRGDCEERTALGYRVRSPHQKGTHKLSVLANRMYKANSRPVCVLWWEQANCNRTAKRVP